jgi:hypothetical protein
LHVKAVGLVVWPRYGGGVGGDVRDWCAGTAWLGRGPADVTHRSYGAQRTDHWTRAGLGVRARPVRLHADATGR